MPSVAIVEAALRLDAQQFTKAIDQAKASVQKFAGDSRAVAAGVGAGLLSASVGLGALALNLKAAGDEADAIGDSLAQAFSGVQLEGVTKQVLELGAQGVYTEQQFAATAKAVNKFGKEAEPALARLADVAAKSGAPLEALGEAYGRLGRDDKATKALQKLTGISTDQLVAAGAVLDDTTGKLSIAGDNAGKLVDAFNRIADSDRFAGSMMAGTDGASQLTAELKLLKAEIGAGLVSAFESAGAAILPVAKFFRGFSDETKAFVGVGIAVAAAAAGLGSFAIAGTLAANALAGAVISAGGLAAFLGPLAATLTGLATTVLPAVTVGLTGLVTIFNPLTLIVLGLAAAMKTYIDTLDEAAKNAEELFQIEEKRAAAARTAEQFIGKSAGELAKAGKTAKDVAAVADGLADRAQQAYEAGNDALFQRLKKQVADLRSVQRELSVMEADKRETAQIQEQAKAALGPAPDAAALEAQAKLEDADRARRQEADQKAADERAAQDRAEHAKRIKIKQDALDRGAKIEIAAGYPIAKAAENLTSKLKAEQEKRVKDQADAAAQALKIAQQNAQDLADAQGQARDLKGQALDNQVQDLQTQTEQTGKDNTGAIRKAIEEKLALDIEAIRLEADKAKAATDSAQARVLIEENATEQIRQLQRQGTQDLRDELQKQADAIKAAEADKNKQRGAFTLGGTFGIADLNSSIQGSLSATTRPSKQNAFSNVQALVQPLPSAVPNDPSFDKLSSAADVLLAAAGKLNSAADKEPRVTVVQQGGTSSRSAPSGDGRQGALVTTSRSTTRRS